MYPAPVYNVTWVNISMLSSPWYCGVNEITFMSECRGRVESIFYNDNDNDNHTVFT